MGINKTLKLSWEGEEYHVLVTMRLIDMIEDDGHGDINLMKMAAQVSQDDLRYSQASKLIAILLQSAGCNVTQDDVWDGLCEDGDMTASKAITVIYEFFDAAFYSSSKKKPTKVKSKNSKNTRGKQSTN